MDKYEDFILEKKIIDIINESRLMASGNFLDKLSFISKKNKIAKILYNLFDVELYLSADIPQNWIDVLGEDTVSFISDLKALKVDRNIETPYSTRGRSEVKIGRFVNALLNNTKIKDELRYLGYDKIEFNDKDIEEFVNLYKSTNIDNTKEFKIISGLKIARWYNMKKYANERGTLGSSCMKDVPDDYFDIYTKNPKVCRLLIYVNSDNKLLGRAIIWKLHESPCEAKYFMDRVYVSNDSDTQKFKNYADEQGWLYKNKMTYSNTEGLFFRYKGGPVFGRIIVKLKNTDYGDFPYVDTLTFFNAKKKMLSNVGWKDEYMLDSTDGYGDNRCDNCDGEGEFECNHCYGKKQMECKACNGKGKKGWSPSKIKGVDCDVCKGKGTVKCNICDGIGSVLCPECVGIEKKVKNLIINGSNYPDYKNVI